MGMVVDCIGFEQQPFADYNSSVPGCLYSELGQLDVQLPAV